MLINTIYAICATLSFGVVLNIRGKKLIFSAIGGGIGWFVYLFLINIMASKGFALFIASIAVGVYSEIMARLLKTPVTTFVIAAIIPLVPGNGMYYTMYESIKGEATQSLTTCIQTFSSAGAIAAGLVLISSTTKLIHIKNKID
jgi:uncharacterized membrane protein YjjB (DUF3815 family)